MVFNFYFFFCAWLWLLRARLQATVAPKMARGWDGGGSKTAFQKARPGVLVFANARVLGVSGTEEGWEQRGIGSSFYLFYFCSQYSTWKALSGR